MKKQIIALALISGLTMTSVASAHWGKGNHGQGGGGCQQMQAQKIANLDQETKDKIKQFFKDNKSLVKQMVMKRAEKKALMRSDSPDPAVASTLAGEIFDLRISLKEKAEEAGVEQYVGMGRMGMGGFDGHGGRGGRFGHKGMRGDVTKNIVVQ